MRIRTVLAILILCAGSPFSRAADGEEEQSQSAAVVNKSTVEYVISDEAQLRVIALKCMAFLTGDFACDTFFPFEKTSDYFGFQYIRDTDAGGEGGEAAFLGHIANNVLAVLNDKQMEMLMELAKDQQDDMRLFSKNRMFMIGAFRRNLDGDIPFGSSGLSLNEVAKYSARLYELDGRMAFQRAEVIANIIRGLTESQKATLAKLKYTDSRTWPDMPDQLDRTLQMHLINLAVATWAGEIFSWCMGSPEADAYFSAGRHGAYFGGLAMNDSSVTGISSHPVAPSVKDDVSVAFLSLLSDARRKFITDLPELQREDLREAVRTRQAIVVELRHLLKGEAADKERVLSLSKRYGELDGAISHCYATAFAMVGRTLSAQQKKSLNKMRVEHPLDIRGPFLYSLPVRMPDLDSTDILFDIKW